MVRIGSESPQSREPFILFKDEFQKLPIWAASIKRLAEEIGAVVVEQLFARLRAGNLLPVAPEYLTASQVAQMTTISTKRLESWRSERKEIPYFKPSNGRVLYKRADVIAWVEKGGPMK